MTNKQSKKKTVYQRILLGIKLGWNTPTLPEEVLNFQAHPFMRIFRVLGGISTVLILTKKSLLFPAFFLYIFFVISLAFFIYHTIISYYRLKHIYKTIKSDKLDIKNSPVDKLATLAGKVLLCIKGSCDQLPHLGLGLGIGAATDQILENSGRDPIFMPFLGGMLNKMIGNETVGSIYSSRKEAYKELLSLDTKEKLLLEDKKSLDDLLKSGFLSEQDKKIIAKDFWVNKESINSERSKLISSIASELEKKDPFGTGTKK